MKYINSDTDNGRYENITKNIHVIDIIILKTYKAGSGDNTLIWLCVYMK